jgi:hypothetical protein
MGGRSKNLGFQSSGDFTAHSLHIAIIGYLFYSKSLVLMFEGHLEGR